MGMVTITIIITMIMVIVIIHTTITTTIIIQTDIAPVATPTGGLLRPTLQTATVPIVLEKDREGITTITIMAITRILQ
jgi:hypothetical protein